MPAVLTFPKLPQRGSSVLHTHAHPFFSINFFLMKRRYFKHLLVDGWQRINKCLGGGPRGIRMLWLNDQRVTSAKRCSQCQAIRGRHDLGARAKSCVPLRRMWRIAYTYAHTHRGEAGSGASVRPPQCLPPWLRLFIPLLLSCIRASSLSLICPALLRVPVHPFRKLISNPSPGSGPGIELAE